MQSYYTKTQILEGGVTWSKLEKYITSNIQAIPLKYQFIFKR